jgi:hypothetical protein
MNGHAPAKTSNTTRTNAKGKHMQAQTGPVTLPPPTDAQRADMKRPATNGNDVVVKVEDTMDEGQLDKLATGVTVDTTTGASSVSCMLEIVEGHMTNHQLLIALRQARKTIRR